MSIYIDCKNVVKAYRAGDHELVALKGIDFKMERGEMVAIVGPSGAGKSSLLNLLGGLDVPTAGQLTIDNVNLLELKGKRLMEHRLQRVGFIWQDVGRNLMEHRSALHNVMLPMMLAGMGYRQRRRRALELLDTVGLHEHSRKRPSALSGGQQQRVALAIALANQPNLLLADEPTGALDRETATQVMELIQTLRETYQLTVLLVTHDPVMAAYADRVLTLRDGALGQDITEAEASQGLHLDEEGRLALPERIQHTLQNGNISVEIRPEGVLLRPEQADEWGELSLESENTNHSGKRWYQIWRRGA